MGVLRRQQNRPAEAVAWLGRALGIAGEYEMHVGMQILADLADLYKEMGEPAFTAAWRAAFEGQAPPLDAIKHVIDQLDSAAPAD